MSRKFVLIFLVFFAIVLLGSLGPARADDGELAAISSALHQHHARWIAGENSVSRLPAHERAMRVRLIKPNLNGPGPVITQSAPQTYALNPTLDWRNNGGNFVTPVRDQGNCGSCWAFGTAAALESYLLITQPTVFNQQTLDLAEQVLVSCSGAGSCNGGSINKASDYVRDTGLPPEGYDSYTATNGTCPPLSSWQGAADKSQGWAWVTTTSVSVDALKNALATYGPLITTMEVYSDFFYYAGGVYHYTSGSLQGGHAVLLVGYDDVNQCFIVKNSWGTWWGEQGFFRIGYSEISSVVLFGQYTIANIHAAPPAPTCSFSISPTSASVGATASAGSVTVTASAGTCGWTASSNSSWISTSQASGTGSATVTYSVQANTGQARTGTATIAGKTFTVNQAAAAGVPIMSVSATAINFSYVPMGWSSTGYLYIYNKGTGSLTTSIGITGQSASDFSQASSCGSVAPNGSCTVRVTFRPSSRASKSASLNITSNDPAHAAVTVLLSGRGY